MIKSINKQFFIKSCLLTPKIKPIDINSLKYVTNQLSTEAIKPILSEHFGPQNLQSLEDNNTTFLKARDKVDIAKLEELAAEGKTLKEMAEIFDVSFSTIKQYLDKYKITSVNRNEIRAIKKFISAKTDREKAETFAEVDKYLVQIAKEKYQPNSTTTVDDCLQDLRINFIKLAQKKQLNTILVKANIFNLLRENSPKEVGTPDFCDVSAVADSLVAPDPYAKSEDNEYWNFIIKNSRLSKKSKSMLIDLVMKDIPIGKIAKKHNLTIPRVKDIITDSFKSVKRFVDIASSDKYFNKKSEYAQKVINDPMDFNKKTY